MKISRFKGSPRDRSEIPAAEWFTYPGDITCYIAVLTVVNCILEGEVDYRRRKKRIIVNAYIIN